jgi:hypothetical protein
MTVIRAISRNVRATTDPNASEPVQSTPSTCPARKPTPAALTSPRMAPTTARTTNVAISGARGPSPAERTISMVPSCSAERVRRTVISTPSTATSSVTNVPISQTNSCPGLPGSGRHP